MEYGLIANINQFKDNQSQQIQKIQESNPTSKVDDRSKLEQYQEDELVKAKELEKTSKVSSQASNHKYEVVLTNMNFGFNDSSKDFFVKATRGNSENQYPTEDMMKMKSYILNQG